MSRAKSCEGSVDGLQIALYLQSHTKSLYPSILPPYLMQSDAIQVRFDKSHLITIGEKLYGESMELIRELVSNAYDADAEHVWIDVTPETLSVRDDGWGMDEAGLREYFTI